MIRSTLFLALCLAAMPAQATSARLLAPDDAPVAGSAPAPAPAPAPAAAPAPAPSVASAASVVDSHLSGTTHFLISAGVGVFAVPGSLLLSSFLGGLPLTIAGSSLGSLLLSGLPALLVMGFGAPLVVTFVAYTLGKMADPGRYAFGPAFWLSSLVNIVALVAGGAMGLSVGVPLRLMLFSLIDGALIGGTSVGVMRMFEKAPTPVASFVPGVSETRVVPLAQVAF